MITVIDLDAIEMDAKAKMLGWEAEFAESYYRPLIQAQMLQAFLEMTSDVREQLRQSDKELFDQLNKQANRLAGGLKDGN